MSHIYILRRFLQLIIVLFISSLVIFLLFRVLIPGDPVSIMLGTDYTPEAYNIMVEKMGMNKPIYLQYIYWVRDVLKGDFGKSIISKDEVLPLIISKLPITLMLAFIGIGITFFLTIIVSLVSVFYHESLFDNLIRVFSIAGICVPTQWLALLLLLLFSVNLKWLPAGGYANPLEDGLLQYLHYSILPLLTIIIQELAVQVRFLRSGLLSVMGEDYIKTAQSKGLKDRDVLLKHALKNAFKTYITVVGISLAKLMGGLIIVERVFNIPGMGWLLIRSLNNRDFPVIQAGILFTVTFYVLINLIVDFTYIIIDPRIKLF